MLNGYAQTKAGKADFRIFGHISGRDTGSVILWYMNSANEYLADTTSLDHGRFTFSANVRSACEALIWTNLQNRYYDDQSVIRFILAPGLIHISKTDGEKKVTITGSQAQDEKVKWEILNASLLEAQGRCFDTLVNLNNRNLQAGGSVFKIQLDSVKRQLDSLGAIRTKLDIGYVAKHPGSYLSGYLLRRQFKNISVDSVKLLYAALADSVKNSSLGYEVLKYVYPLTDDEAFKNSHPLNGADFHKRLAGIRSIYDFSLRDRTGKLVDFTMFKGKYLLVHAWASWCKPCIADIPVWNNLLKRYDQDNIQFVTVSLDSKVDSWKQAVGKYKPGGIQLIDSSSFAGLFAVYCKILYVGKYLIADPKGRIVNYDVAQTGEAEWRRWLDKLIKKGVQ